MSQFNNRPVQQQQQQQHYNQPQQFQHTQSLQHAQPNIVANLYTANPCIVPSVQHRPTYTQQLALNQLPVQQHQQRLVVQPMPNTQSQPMMMMTNNPMTTSTIIPTTSTMMPTTMNVVSMTHPMMTTPSMPNTQQMNMQMVAQPVTTMNTMNMMQQQPMMQQQAMSMVSPMTTYMQPTMTMNANPFNTTTQSMNTNPINFKTQNQQKRINLDALNQQNQIHFNAQNLQNPLNLNAQNPLNRNEQNPMPPMNQINNLKQQDPNNVNAQNLKPTNPLPTPPNHVQLPLNQNQSSSSHDLSKIFNKSQSTKIPLQQSNNDNRPPTNPFKSSDLQTNVHHQPQPVPAPSGSSAGIADYFWMKDQSENAASNSLGNLDDDSSSESDILDKIPEMDQLEELRQIEYTVGKQIRKLEREEKKLNKQKEPEQEKKRKKKKNKTKGKSKGKQKENSKGKSKGKSKGNNADKSKQSTDNKEIGPSGLFKEDEALIAEIVKVADDKRQENLMMRKTYLRSGHKKAWEKYREMATLATKPVMDKLGHKCHFNVSPGGKVSIVWDKSMPMGKKKEKSKKRKRKDVESSKNNPPKRQRVEEVNSEKAPPPAGQPQAASSESSEDPKVNFHDPYGSFTLDSEVEDDDITELPLREKKVRGPKVRIKKSWTKEPKCDHLECAKLENAWLRSEEDFDEWKEEQERIFKKHLYPQQVQMMNPLIQFRTPVKKLRPGTRTNRYGTVKSYDHWLPGPGKRDRFRVCPQYFRWFWSIGKTQLQTIQKKLYNGGKSTMWIEAKQNYKGYRNNDAKPEWIQKWARWAVEHKSLVRSHYTTKKDTVYFEAENGVKHTWTSLYRDFIKFDQPESFNNWLIKKNPPKDPTIPKPKPSLHHFYKIVPKLFRCKPRRISQDVCNGCKMFEVLLSENKDSDSQTKYTRLLQNHLNRGRMMYQLNSHFKKICTASFKDQGILVRRGTPPMEHKDTWVRYEFDYDLDHPEIFHVLNMVYFKRKITMKSLNVVQQPADCFGDRKVFAWSGMIGGKAFEETIQCLEHCFKKRSIGAERCFLNCDGALITYNLLMFAAFCCHPKNPNRYFKAVHAASPETGHSRLDADSINQQATKHYKKRSHWSTTAERVDYINENTDIEMMEWKYFGTLPTIYKKIFLKQDKWMDQHGKHAAIKNDKGMIYEFGQSFVWNADSGKFECVEHPDEMWIRCNEDLKGKLRKIRIFKKEVENVPESEWRHLRRERKPFPVIQREKLNDTLEIVKFFPNSQELTRYYTPAEIDDSGEIKPVKCVHNYSKIVTKMVRREQHLEMLQTDTIIDLEQYEQKQQAPPESCNAKIKIRSHQIDAATGKALKEALRLHSVAGGSKKRKELQRLYREHIENLHAEDQSFQQCPVQPSIQSQDIDSKLVAELKKEVKAHGLLSSNKKKEELREILRDHLEEFHSEHKNDQDMVSCDEPAEGSDFVSDFESSQDIELELTSDEDPAGSGGKECESESESSSGVID